MDEQLGERSAPAARRGILLRVLPWAVAVLAAIPFLPALSAGWVNWDDPVNFTDNPHYRGFSAENLRWMFTALHAGHYMPVTWLSCALDYELWDMDPRGYHLTNLLLHCLNAVLVFHLMAALLRRTAAGATGGAWVGLAAAAGALLFAVHPLRVESVAWATERRDVLSSFFFLACILLYLRAAEDGPARRRWLALSVAACILSLLCKATGASLPVVLLVLDGWPLGRLRGGQGRWRRWRAALVGKLPFLVPAVAAAGLAVLGQARGTQELAGWEEYGLLPRIMQTAAGLLFYPWRTLWPAGLAPLYEIDRTADPLGAARLLSMLAVLLLTGALLAARRRWPWALAAWLAYAVVALPLIGPVQTGIQVQADRYSYLSMLPAAALAAAALLRLPARRVSFSVATAVLLLLGAMSWGQTRVWTSSESLWRRVVEVEPASYTGHQMLGVVLHRKGRFEEAAEVFRRGLAAREGQEVTELRYNLALSLLRLGRTEEAWGEIEATLDAEPAHRGALEVLRELARARGQPGLARARLERAVALEPGQAGAWQQLARFRLSLSHWGPAAEAARRAVEADPSDGVGHNLEGLILLQQHRFAEAEAPLRRAVERGEQPTFWINLGICLVEQGRVAEARAAWVEALKLDGDNQTARSWLARHPG